ncbi:MAG: hypothetical protein ACK46X_01835 [Candidatus Sericytochromatia bacterium]
MQIGGDSQNTTPVAIQSGLQAQKLAKPMLDAAKEGGAKLPWDKFISTVKNQTAANAPLADAMQQQSFFVKWAQKIPGVGPRLTAWLGPEAMINNTIGSLPKEVVKQTSAANLTRIVYEGGDDVAKKLIAAGVPQETAETLAKAGAERLGKQVAQSAAQSAATSAVAGLSDDAVKAVLAGAKNGGVLAGKNVTSEAIQQALKNGGDDVVGALRQLGLRADTAKALAAEAGKSAAKTATETGVKQAVTEGAEEGVKAAAKSGGVKGFFGKLFSGAKGNFIISGIFSLGSNAIQLATGKMNVKQFVALTGMDTLAYGAIGLGASAAGGAVAGAIGQALIPIPGLGFLVGLGLGMAGGLLYEKFLRNPVKDMLGGGAAPDAAQGQQQGVAPGEYADPYQAGNYQDPYAQPAAPAPQGPVAAPVGDVSYEDAMQYLESLPQQ